MRILAGARGTWDAHTRGRRVLRPVEEGVERRQIWQLQYYLFGTHSERMKKGTDLLGEGDGTAAHRLNITSVQHRLCSVVMVSCRSSTRVQQENLPVIHREEQSEISYFW